MRKILFGLLISGFAVSLATAQESATQQQIDQLTGKIQDLTDMQAAQGKKIAELEKQISDLSDKLNQPAAANNSASADDIKRLTEAIQKVDKSRQDDNEKIMKVLDKLAKGGGVSAPPRSKPAVPADNTTPSATAPAPGGKQNGYYYEVKDKDTLIAIAKAYSAELKTKITPHQILAANPGLTAKNLSVGKKIFIPDPNAK